MNALTNNSRLTLNPQSKICAEIYRNDTGGGGHYSFACFYCGHICDCFDEIDTHISDIHFSNKNDNNSDHSYKEEKGDETNSEDNWTCIYAFNINGTLENEEDLSVPDNFTIKTTNATSAADEITVTDNSSTLPNSRNGNGEGRLPVSQIESKQTALETECGQKQFECYYCKKRCEDKKDVFTHLSLSHITKKCLRNIKNHLPLHKNDNNQKYKCHICSKILSSKKNLMDYIRTHTGEKPYSYKFCEKSFSSTSIVYHPLQNQHSNKKFKCHLCPKILSSKQNLTHHIRTHTGEKPYSCKFCKKRFSVSYELNYHLRTNHSNKKKKDQFKCDVCSKILANEANLKNHIRIVHLQPEHLKKNT